jgi:hypothetical protein
MIAATKGFAPRVFYFIVIDSYWETETRLKHVLQRSQVATTFDHAFRLQPAMSAAATIARQGKAPRSAAMEVSLS